MNSKNILILLIVFVIFTLLAGYQFFQPKLFVRTEDNGYAKSFAGIDSKNIITIEISGKETTIKIDKESDLWKIDKKKADKEKIDEFVKTLTDFKAAQLVAETNVRHKEFELTDDLATKIKLNGKLSLLIGKSSDIGSGKYLRFDGSDRVYFLKNLNASMISTTKNDWLDKTIVKIEENKLKKLIFDGTSGKFTLLRSDGKWKLEGEEKELDSDKISQITANLSSFQAISFPDEKEIAQSQNKVLTLEIGSDQETETLEFYKGKSSLLVKRISDKEYFTVGEFLEKTFLLSKGDLLKK